MKHIAAIGGYFIMLYNVFRKRTRWSIMKDLVLREIDDLIFSSIGIVAFISFFVGGVVSVQTALNIDNPFIPKYLIGFATRQSIILEFAPTFIAIILAGKVGSFITSSIGTMRVTEQIDALDMMGINSLNYLVFPKIIALLLLPFLIAMGMYLGILGGWASAVVSGYTTSSEFVQGVQLDFKVYSLIYAFTKTLVFAFFLATIPAYHGYFMRGGALDVGKASTTSFVWTSIVIILSNSIITQLFYA
ncbi:MAG: ABC transporter permease [Capnocytophaga felis]|nr:ABC transporter permease [Capnocytophaga felis]